MSTRPTNLTVQQTKGTQDRITFMFERGSTTIALNEFVFAILGSVGKTIRKITAVATDENGNLMACTAEFDLLVIDMDDVVAGSELDSGTSITGSTPIAFSAEKAVSFDVPSDWTVSYAANSGMALVCTDATSAPKNVLVVIEVGI